MKHESRKRFKTVKGRVQTVICSKKRVVESGRGGEGETEGMRGGKEERVKRREKQ